MICDRNRTDVERFRDAITRETGILFDEARFGFLGEVLQRRLEKLGNSSEAYIAGLRSSGPSGEVTELAREITVGETYFFRNIDQFRALEEIVLPERMDRVGRDRRTLRMLSAGCASGEEAYTLAMVAREAVTDPAWTVDIRAVDLNPAALEKAQRARYSTWALRETPAEMQIKWFRGAGRELVLDDQVRRAVKFELANLVSEDSSLWQPETYDVIFCRNVLMYFAPERMRAVIERIARSLAPGGFLFLGHAETLRGISDEFHLRHTHGTFYYERKGHGEARRALPVVTDSLATAKPSVAPVTGIGDDWFHSISQATARVQALIGVPGAERAGAEQAESPWDLAPAFDLLRRERFADALHHVRGGPPERARDPDVQLLEATLLAHGGEIAAAEEVCRRLLLVDELNAGAHYVLGHCREQAADLDNAREHFRVAAYLDPDFAMPRLHLGLLARRCGERSVARRELAQALVLLKREDASRLLLFGGGFNREALMRLCESALKESGGRP